MSIWGDRLTAILSIAVAAYMIYLGWNFPANGSIFPKFICGAIAVIAVLLVLRTVSVKAVYDRTRINFSPRDDLLPLVITAYFVAYAVVIFIVGYYTTTLIFLVSLSLVLGIRNPLTLVLMAGITLPLLYAFFELFLGADMPRGALI